MGNCCGKPDADPFAGQGRVLGTAPPKAQTAPVPAARAKTVGGPPRPLGGSGSGSGSGDADARRRAAEAAEVRFPYQREAVFVPGRLADEVQARAKGTGKPRGKLADQLDAQRRQTRTDTLKEASADETRRREVAASTEARNYN